MSNHPWGDSSFFWYLNSYANRTPSAVVPSPLNLSTAFINITAMGTGIPKWSYDQ